jgi:malic enzyme
MSKRQYFGTQPTTLTERRRGYAVIRDPLTNKSSAFLPAERTALGLHGLLPPQTHTMDQQMKRAYANVEKLVDPLDKYMALAALQDRNEHLFYRVLMEHLEKLMPIVYTPTVGAATRHFSQVFQRGRGVWISPDQRGRIAEVLEMAAHDREIRLIVATDNESILGIGDQGAGGMAISVGKLSLYTAGAGIHPGSTLPVSIDVGTNNQELLANPLYLGWPKARLKGAAYDDLIEEFVQAVAKVFPDALIQWEDLRKDNALAVLDRYRERFLSFNDDIQGTGAIAVAGLLSSERITKRRPRDERVIVYGAGAAGLGIARQIRSTMALDGVPADGVTERVALLDSRGLLVADREMAESYKRELAWPRTLVSRMGITGRELGDVVRVFKPTVLIGTSGQAGAFTDAIVRDMAAATERPVVLPFSNPTDYAEARPDDVLRASDGRALVATGSPFAPVQIGDRTIHIGQGNNVFIFPGLGLGALLCRARRVSDAMIAAAAQALADTLLPDELAKGLLFPSVKRLRTASARVARAVIERAVADGDARQPLTGDIEAIVKTAMWEPRYPEYAAEA